jgi:hypothetical protein
MSRATLALATFALAASACHKAPPASAAAPKVIAAPAGTPAADEAAQIIQVAFLVDTSQPMEAYLPELKTRLWHVADELARATRDGRPARLELALYEYGRDALADATAHVRQVQPFTANLEYVAQALLRLSTDPGRADSASAIFAAVDQLAWSRDPADLRLMIVAAQGAPSEDTEPAITAARAQGVVVDVVQCGKGDTRAWQAAAAAGEGRFLAIDAVSARAPVVAPQDAELARLRTRLESFGCHVDPSLPIDQLPPEMRQLDRAQREAYVDDLDREQKQVEERIAALEGERTRWMDAERLRRGDPDATAIAAGFTDAAHAHAAALGFAIE